LGTSEGTEKDARWIASAGCVLIVVFLLTYGAAPASAVQVHALDPLLSLTGGTGTTSLDPVPDPGPTHPAKPFDNPCGVATDDYGDIYVASVGSDGSGAIYVFGPDGRFITEMSSQQRSCSLAVDSEGRLFAYRVGAFDVARYDPLVYQPATRNIQYGPASPVVVGATERLVEGMTLDPSNDHLYVSYSNFESRFLFEDVTAGEGFTENVFGDPRALAVWGTNHDIISSGDPWEPIYDPSTGLVSVLDAVSHEVTLTLDGSTTPDGSFGFEFGRGGVAVDQANGDIYVDDIAIHHVVDQFDSSGKYLGQLKLESNGLKSSEPFSAIAVDRGENSPNKGYVYVTSGSKATNAHLYAFALLDVGPPEVKEARAENIGETEAVLAAQLNPHGAATSYRFEYGTANCATSTCESAPVPEGDGGSAGAFHPVSVPVAGLSPGATYHFRVVATSNCNPSEPAVICVASTPDATFTTFSAPAGQACANAGMRTGASAALPDCRAYELVTPPDTNGRIPTSTVFGTGPTVAAPVLLAAAEGNSVLFGTEGGVLPGSEGSGLYDVYQATRGSGGWSTEFSGLNGQQAAEPYPVMASPDTAYTSWLVLGDDGSLVDTSGGAASYLRGPGGSITPVGQGSLTTAPGAETRWISTSAGHLIFTSAVRLETAAPPTGTITVYDRSPGGPTHVVSLLPGNVTPLADEDATYLGTAAQGGAVAFRIGGAIYERLANSQTVKVTDGPATYGGMSADGSRVFFVAGGDIFAFDSRAGTTSTVGSGSESTMVNVSADGSHVYFVSPAVLTGPEANSQGDKASAGAENLYEWDAGSDEVHYIASIEEVDVIGEDPPPGGADGLIGGLGLWTSDAVNPDQSRFVGVANDPSRTNSDGKIFVFESRARLTAYDNNGHTEIYRYDVGSRELGCVSCNPTEAAPSADARLESRYAPLLSSIPPVSAISRIDNLAAGGEIVFFQSAERLAAGDTDAKIDVYEWLAQGIGGCEPGGGCIRLISGGHSSSDDYLYATTPDGGSVFFLSGDTLVGQDRDHTPSIYAARVGGGFPPPPTQAAGCLGEACQGSPRAAPTELSPASATFGGPGNRRPAKRPRCRKPKHGAKARAGKRCAKHRPKSHKQRDAGGGQGK
jgi:hypothetical protein